MGGRGSICNQTRQGNSCFHRRDNGELALDSVGRIERLAMSAEARRNAAWREINRHRDRREFARSLHDEVCAIEKAELQSIGTKTIAPVAATERNVA